MALLKSLPENKWLIAGFGLLAFLMGLGSAISYQNATQLIESSKKSQQTYAVIKSLVNVFATMTVAESGRRGYIYNGERRELARLQTAMSEFEPGLIELRSLIAEDWRQSQRLVKLEGLLNQRLALFRQSIELYRSDKFAILAQSQITERSVALREQIQTLIVEMQTVEEQELKQTLRDSQASIYQRRLIELWVTFSSFSLLFLGFVALYSQLVKRQQAETVQHKLAQQQELSELKLRFFSMVSHEFRTPLSVILGSVQLLMGSNQQWTEDRKQKNLSRIQSSAKVMIQLLSDILTLNRAEAGKLQCNPDSLDLEAFCLNLIEDFQCYSSSIYSFELTSHCQYTHAYLDEKLLYSTLSNLLSNSMKYSPSGGVIQLTLKCEAEVVIFEVKDQGLGISLDDQRSLYEPFFRGQNATAIAGTGLGLAVVRKCVDLQKGEITVESQPDLGTTFTIKIPRHCSCNL